MKKTLAITENLLITLALSCLFSGAFAAPPAPTKKDLTFIQLKNTTYFVPSRAGALQPVTMTTGAGKSGNQVTIGLEKAAFGDLNKDGVEDAAAIYWFNTGNDSYWRILGAFISENGEAVNVDNKTLGEKVTVVSVAVREGRIEVVLMDASAGAPVKKTETFVINKDKHLTQVENVAPAPVKPAAPAKPGAAPAKRTPTTGSVS
jgi:hypothetical protein